MEFRIKLRPFKREDAAFVNKLRQHENSENTVGGNKRPVSYERDVKWVEDIMLSDNQKVIYFALSYIENDDIIGYVSISDIDYRNGTCFWSGTKIDPTISSKGLGTESSVLLLRYIFEEMRMERCKGEALENNIGALRMLEKLGFKKEGLQRHSVYKNGQYNSQWILSMLKNEYISLKENLQF
jgi:RimJ/RimL family protein N-acetyltransferase